MCKRPLAFVILVALCGCGKDEEKIRTPEGDVTIQKGGDRITVKTDEGTAVIDTGAGKTQVKTDQGTLTLGKAEVPKGFPLPIMPGAQVQQSMHQSPRDGKETFFVTFQSPVAADQAAGFYKKVLEADKKLKVEQIETTTPQSKIVSLSGQSDSAEAAVTINSDGKATTVSLMWTNKGPGKQ